MAKAATSGIYQLKITLKNAKPPIWRRIEVTSETKLDSLAMIILAVMGWDNSHLHQFIVGHTYYSMPDPDDMMDSLDERKYTLAQILPKEKAQCIFEYDFGDGWEHELFVEKVLEAEPKVKYPRCTAGKMACPPEDCGGVWGYMNLIEILKDSEHEEHETYVDWLGLESGEDFDPKEFSVEVADERLQWARK
jgi:hypothetical protein